MLEKLIKDIKNILDLQYVPVGVKFIPFKEDYEKLGCAELSKKRTVCGMVKHAYDGNVFKVYDQSFACDYGRCALGIGEPFHSSIMAGQSFDYCGLYENYMVAHKFVKTLKYCQHRMYGVQFGPLYDVENPDVVIMVVNARQAMRIMQGYTYKYGPALNLGTGGNQAMCSDMISKVVENNDLNISLMCRGARTYTQCEDGEMGVAKPFFMFENVAAGIIKTITPVEHDPIKKVILNRLDPENEVCKEIVLGQNYSIGLKEFADRVEN